MTRALRSERESSATEHVVDQIRELIARGELKPGDQLPPERSLAKRLGISRPSLRAGLQALISMGVLRARQGSGTFITEGPPRLDSEPLRFMAALHGFTFDHMFEARRVIEESVAALAAERAEAEQLSLLAAEIDRMEAALGDPQRYLIHDVLFHQAMAAASGNPILATLVEMVSVVLYEQRRKTIDRAHDFSESLELHRQIFRAISRRDATLARAAMHEHLVRAQRAYESEEERATSRSRRRK
jgi:GntR family transcriptional repressor for pyruvate dehydrogenase complex